MTVSELDGLFETLVDAMNRADATAIASCFQTPGFGYRDGVVFAFATGADVSRHADAVIDRYRGADVRQVREETTAVEWLGGWAALVTRSFVAESDSAIVAELVTTYLVLRGADGPRIVAYVNHDGGAGGDALERDAVALAEVVRAAFASRAAGAVADIGHLPAYGVQDGLVFAVDDEASAVELAFSVIAHYAGMGMADVTSTPGVTAALGAWCVRTTHTWTFSDAAGATLQELTLTFLVVRESDQPVVLAYIAHD